ncbi:hypothetical protein [Mesorhizobium sp. B2-3-14]|uniref:hypothetical protein n=1 Tax=Mesorhizobium sp. B2-3-14 TaxID=2589950 RepID=UPI001FEED8A7|nr:hypothetical protein [Mesorhizobium sp. B2-3-14]
MRAQGIDIPITTVDLGLRPAIEIAKGVPLKATGSWRPDDKGVAEALAMMKALIGEPTPASIGVQALPTVQSGAAGILQDGLPQGPAGRSWRTPATRQAEVQLR